MGLTLHSELTTMKIFLCHSSQDKVMVRAIATILRKAGVSVWYDDWEIKWGDSIVEKINKGLESHTSLVVFLSAAAVSSPWVQRELNSTLMDQLRNEQVRIFPVKLEECPVPPLLRELKWISLAEPESYNSGLKKMFEYFLPLPVAKLAVGRIDEFVSELIRDSHKTNLLLRQVFICPNCGGRALTAYAQKRDTPAPKSFRYELGIQCEQCGMLYMGTKGKQCSNCGSPMLWRSYGSSEGAHGGYEDDFTWKCPKCGLVDYQFR